MAFLIAFSAAQGLVLLFYSLSGVYKVGSAVVAFSSGKVSGFAPEVMVVTLAQRSVQTGTDPIWAPFVIERPLVGLAALSRFLLHRVCAHGLSQARASSLLGVSAGIVPFRHVSFHEHFFPRPRAAQCDAADLFARRAEVE